MNLNYSIATLAQITNAAINGDQALIVQHIIVDSRNFYGNSETLFCAIKGSSDNGHNYILDLFQRGCRVFMIESESEVSMPNGATVLMVEDVINALQAIAKYHRSQFTYPIIGITGSNGKTIIKEWLYYFLKDKYNIIRSPKSYNSQLGVPLSILQMTKLHNLAIIEAGISQKGEMEKLEQIIQPNIGILTYLGSAHSENFANESEIKSEKMKLFANSEWLYTFEENNAFLANKEIGNYHSLLTFLFNNHEYIFEIPFTDDAYVQNAITTISFLLKFGYSPELITEESPNLPNVALRLESRKGINNTILINDSYSNDLNSLDIALNHLSKSIERSQKIVLLSDIYEDQHLKSDLYETVSKMISASKIDGFIGIGEDLFSHQYLFKDGNFYETTEQFINQLNTDAYSDAIILIKGARKFHFEKIGRLLEEKTHETKLSIDLGALKNNIKRYRSLINSDTKIMCMVKAFGYGSGSNEIGKILQEANVDYLGVAYADEGEELRRENITLPIIVMNSETHSFDQIIQNNLEPSIFSFKQLDQFIRALIDLDIKSYPIHIKIDTGMNRLGFLKSEIEQLISTISSQPEVRVKSIFSHLAASDDEREDLFTQKQIQIFQYVSHQIESSLGYNCIKHICNTAGIERFPQAQMDMVRLGLGMFGISNNLQNLEIVGQFTSVVSQIKKVKKGESIGYNRSQYALDDMTIGIVPVGYADGFSRNLSNGKGSIWINNQVVKTVGRVCMDMIMVDLTDIKVQEGDEVEIFGTHKSIKDHAKEMDTITYEVMTSISQRVQRIYLM